MSIHALHDDHGRTVRYLRLSLTDRCNLRCLYCHSNARHQCIPHEKVLRYEEMIRLVQIVRGMGVGKVRLTGGEPFARKGCDDFLLRLRQRFDDLDIRITTNGTLLEEHIPLLQRIRISAVNLSLDSFDRETFARVTGRDMLPEVLRALDAMLAAGIRVKINAVGLRGINDGQLADFVHAAMTLPVDVRFIEFMPMGMNSMKRTSTGRVMAAWTKSASWPSLMPRRPTALILTRMPAASMASRARSTSGSMSRPVTRAKVSRSKLSSDRFTALMRIRCSRGMCSSSSVPLVVMRMSRSSKRCRNRRRKSSQPLRAKGSPPVRRTFPTPMPRTICTRRIISS